PERLEENDISWRVYQNEITTGSGLNGEKRAWLSNFGCNPLEYFTQYNARFADGYIQGLQSSAELLSNEIDKLENELNTLSNSSKDYNKTKQAISKKKDHLQSIKIKLSKWSYEQFNKLSEKQQNLFKNAFTTNKGDPNYRELTQLRYEHNGSQKD